MGKISEEKLAMEVKTLKEFMHIKYYTKLLDDLVEGLKSGKTLKEMHPTVREIREEAIKDKNYLKGDIAINLRLFLEATGYTEEEFDKIVAEAKEGKLKEVKQKEAKKEMPKSNGRHSRFSTSQIKKMKEMRKTHTVKELSDIFGVCERQILNLTNGKTKNTRKGK